MITSGSDAEHRVQEYLGFAQNMFVSRHGLRDRIDAGL